MYSLRFHIIIHTPHSPRDACTLPLSYSTAGCFPYFIHHSSYSTHSLFLPHTPYFIFLLHTSLFLLHISHFTLPTPHSIFHSPYSTLYISLCQHHTPNFSFSYFLLYTSLFELCLSILPTLHSILSAPHTILHTTLFPPHTAPRLLHTPLLPSTPYSRVHMPYSLLQAPALSYLKASISLRRPYYHLFSPNYLPCEVLFDVSYKRSALFFIKIFNTLFSQVYR
jgi:hypothetical protein